MYMLYQLMKWIFCYSEALDIFARKVISLDEFVKVLRINTPLF